MNLLVALRIAKREMRGGFKGFRVFLACLILGVASVATVGSVRTSIEEGLVREGAALLGGDAEMVFFVPIRGPGGTRLDAAQCCRSLGVGRLPVACGGG